MRLTPHEQDRFHFLVIGLVLLIAFLSVMCAIWFGLTKRYELVTELNERSQSIGAALDGNAIAQLKGNSSDDASAVYASIKTKLTSIKHANPDAKSIYLLGKRGDQLFFFANSEQTDSAVYVAPGKIYNDAPSADSRIFIDGRAVVEGPDTDSSGTFISGLAPVYKPDSGQIIAVLGIDVAGETYWADILNASLLPLLAGLATISVIMVFEHIRRHNMQLLALRSELVSVASHELRNPITGIRWAAESLPKLTTDERVLHIAKAILDSALHLQASTNDILELSHAMNRRGLEIAQTDVVPLLKEIADTQALAAQQHNVSIVFDTSWPPSVSINCDADQMKRALQNVVSNAVKYTRDGTQVVMSYRADEHNHYISIADQGIGIPLAEQSKVFRGFYRASNAARSDIPGTGLGLYLVKTVIAKHGGAVSFESEENKGTVFTLSLPK